MRRKYLIRPIIVSLSLSVSIVFPSVAFAGRIFPKPLLLQFEQGYGVIAAEVVDSKCVAPPDEYPALYDTVFKVHEVTAQPLRGETFKLKSGESIQIRLAAGYACQIEWDQETALAKGKCYYLIVRQRKDKSFEHAFGAAALRSVPKFSVLDGQHYARVRALAGEPEDRRLAAWVKVAARPTEVERLRSDALAGISRKLSTDAATIDSDGASRAALLKLWNDPESKLSLALLYQLDCVLRGTNLNFEDSTGRRDVWLNYLLALTPERYETDRAANDIDNLAGYILRDLAQKHPNATGQRLAARLNDKSWTALYRHAIASGLMTAYQHADRADPTWESVINTYFINLLSDGELYAIRVASHMLENYAGVGSTAAPGARRWYPPNEKVKVALVAGVERLKTAAGQPDADREFNVSASELERVVRLLDGPRKTLPAEKKKD